MAEPTINEVMIHLSNATSQIAEVGRRLDAMQTKLDGSYVRSDVYEHRHEALRAETAGKFQSLEADIRDLQAESKDQAKYRRQTWTAIALALVTGLIGIMVALVTTGSGGGLPT